MSEYELSERKKKILRALVDSYISSVEPISSSAIQAKYLPEVSAATIRSELSMLEELGFLVQPHVSSGRIPSSRAYRYYVDHFIDMSAAIDLKELDTRVQSVENIARKGAKIVSDVTNYTTMLMLTNADSIIVKDVKLVDMYDGNALVLIVTDSGVIKNKEIALGRHGDRYVESADGLLKRAFAGRTLAEILHNDEPFDRELGEFKSLYDEVVELIGELKKVREDEIYIEGTEKIFNYPEYRDIENVKNFMSVVTHKEKLAGLLEDGDIEYSVKIGAEDAEDLQNMAFVSAKYSVGGREVGKVGVIGPERMDYQKVIGVLKQLGSLLGGGDDGEQR